MYSSRYTLHSCFECELSYSVHSGIFLFLPCLDNQQKRSDLLSYNIVPTLFDMLHQTAQHESQAEKKPELASYFLDDSDKENAKVDEREKKESIDFYCVRILIQLALHSSPSDFQGSYSDKDFALLLVSSIFSDNRFLRYGGWTVLKPWINLSSLHKELLSSVAIPSSFITFLSQCPVRNAREWDDQFRNRLKPFLDSLNHALAVVISSIGIGMRLNESSMENLITSLTTLSTDINNAEHSFQSEGAILGDPESDDSETNADFVPDSPSLIPAITDTNRKINKLIRMVEGKPRLLKGEMDEEISRLDTDGDTLLHLLIKKAWDERETILEIKEIMTESSGSYHYLIDQPNNKQQTPLDLAFSTQHLSIVDSLMNHGARFS